MKEKKEKKNQNRRHIQTFLWVQITSTFGDYTKEGKWKGGREKIRLALGNECIGRQDRFPAWGVGWVKGGGNLLYLASVMVCAWKEGVCMHQS